jgi:hypothetical protein
MNEKITIIVDIEDKAMGELEVPYSYEVEEAA